MDRFGRRLNGQQKPSHRIHLPFLILSDGSVNFLNKQIVNVSDATDDNHVPNLKQLQFLDKKYTTLIADRKELAKSELAKTKKELETLITNLTNETKKNNSLQNGISVKLQNDQLKYQSDIQVKVLKIENDLSNKIDVELQKMLALLDSKFFNIETNIANLASKFK